MGRAMERVKNAGLVFCLFVVLLVIFSSYFRANELGTLFGALAGTPVLVHAARVKHFETPGMGIY